MSRYVDGHTFESLGQPCGRCGLPEARYDDRPRECDGVRASRILALDKVADARISEVRNRSAMNASK